ncbi:MAG TPA: M28 family peptidase, partial [Steroidobacteraceae bacterium]|nr:M28 family peptidase [Steroidobacteraceae bacterium]
MRRLLLAASLLFTSAAFAQATKTQGAWFGVKLPPAFGSEPAVIVGAREPRPVIFAPGTPQFPELHGPAIKKDVETIVGFSKASRAAHEFGLGQLWGRVSGFASSDKTVDWAVEQLRSAGIHDVKTQIFDQDPASKFWIPLAWEVRLLGDASFGAGSADVIVESALPVSASEISSGTVTAPLIFVGSGNPSVLDHIDVKGKIAVQLVVPQGHMVFERGAVRPHTQDLFKRGAVAVLNLVRLPGNERSNDFGNCGGACFNIGGRDGQFIENVLDRAAQLGLKDKVRAQLTLKTETRTGLQARNGIAVIPGRKQDETVIIDSHADAWFDGAGDNADGLSVTLALARHFAKPQNQLQRTLVFVVSAGHHSPGLNGVRNFLNSNGELAKRAVLVLNIEHVAQRNFSPARTVAADGYRHVVADSGEAPIVFGVTNAAPYLDELAQQGVARYGVNFISEKSTMQSGETGGFESMNVAKITVMQAPPLYHTTGEVLDVISTPGLERMASFLSYFVTEVAK